MKKLTIIMIAIASLSISCKKEISLHESLSKQPTVTSTEKINPNLRSENGILIFQSNDDFNTEVMNTYKITNMDRIAWEKSHNFVSLHTLFNSLCQEEYEQCLKPYENVTETEGLDLKTPEHMPAYYKLLSEGIIKEVKNADGTQWYDLNCSQMNYAPFISADGIVAIEGDLFQYRDNKAKRLLNAEPSIANIDRLKKAQVSNEAEGIFVVELNQKNRASGTVYFGQPQTTPGASGGIYQPSGSLYQYIFDLSYTHTWNGISNTRAQYFNFNNSMSIYTRKKKNKLASTYYYYPGDHYVWSNTTPFSSTGGVFTSLLVDVNGSPIVTSGSAPNQASWGFPISNTINVNDIGQGNSVFSPSFYGNGTYAAPTLSTTLPVLGLVQSYFATNPVPLMKWNLTGVTPGGSSGQTLYNVKN
jgi:hypothetical protein